MDDAWEQLVRERAYAIWLREGSPDGHAEQFWLMAEEELLAEGHSRPGAADAAGADRAGRRCQGRRGQRRIVPGERSAGMDWREWHRRAGGPQLG